MTLRRAGDDGRPRDVTHFAVTMRAPDLGGVVLYCTHGGWYGELTLGNVAQSIEHHIRASIKDALANAIRQKLVVKDGAIRFEE